MSSVKTRIALSLPVTLQPPAAPLQLGMVTKAEPFQYWTSKSRIPSPFAFVVSVGSPAVVQLSCKVYTRISLIVRLPLRSIASKSGQVLNVPSFQPPPLPQLVPRRSPSITLLAAKL